MGADAESHDSGVGVSRAPVASEGVRILAVGNLYPPHYMGGYELMWQSAMRHARTLGHEVRILTSNFRDGAGLKDDEPDVHRTLHTYWDMERYEFPRLSAVQRLRQERHNAEELRRNLLTFRPDVVAWWSMGCMSLSLIEQVRRLRLPAVFVVHDDWLVYGWQHDQWIRLWRGRRKLVAPFIERVFGVPTEVDASSAGSFVFNSRYTRDRAKEAGVEPLASTVVYPGIGESFLVPLRPSPWRWQLAYVGRIDRQKGVDTAIRALAELPEAARLAVYGEGDGRYVAEMTALANALGVGERVEFAGFVTNSDLRGVYGSADVVVFPVRWEEPFGLVPLEAMGLGVPVVATMRGGTAEFLRDGENALVFEVDDHVGLAEAIRKLGGDGELRARLRDGGHQTATRYTAERSARQTVEEIVRLARR